MSKTSNTASKNFDGPAQDKVFQAMQLLEEVKDQKLEQSKSALRSQIDNTTERIKEIKDSVSDQVDQSIETTEKKIKSNPFKSVAITAGLGLTLGYLLGRRRHN